MRKIFILPLIVLALLLLGVAILNSTNKKSSSGGIEIIITTVPKGAKVFANEKPIKGGKGYLKPGSYTIKATKSGFKDAEEKIEIKDISKKVVLLLAPQSKDAKIWAEQNESKYAEAEGRAGEIAQEEGKEFRRKNPIVAKLPHKNPLVAINYKLSPKDSQKIIVQISAINSIYRDYAIGLIYSWGYSPSDYEIEFIGFNNPLGVNK